jgi:hypothetical protein
MTHLLRDGGRQQAAIRRRGQNQKFVRAVQPCSLLPLDKGCPAVETIRAEVQMYDCTFSALLALYAAAKTCPRQWREYRGPGSPWADEEESEQDLRFLSSFGVSMYNVRHLRNGNRAFRIIRIFFFLP